MSHAAPPARKDIAILLIDAGSASQCEALTARLPAPVRERVAAVLEYPGASRGESQIRGFTHAIEAGYDIVAVLRGDGRDAPEALPELLAPLDCGAAHAVFATRIVPPGGESVGNRLLARFEHAMLGTSFGEFNPGYRLYACSALARVPFQKNSAEARFDTQVIIQLRGAGFRIVEQHVSQSQVSPAPFADSLKYTAKIAKSVVEYELHEFGLQHYPEYVVPPAHTMKHGELSSHSQILELVGSAACSILDVGCGPGELGHVLKERGHEVFGVDWSAPSFELDGFVQADIGQGLPSSIVGPFDIVLLADVLEHMTDPLKLLLEAKQRMKPNGRILVSLPNAVHWSMRAQLAFGRFNYTNKGLLDRGHFRFFTRDSAARMFRDAGFEVVARRTTPVPWENVLPRALGSSIRENAERADYLLTRLRPNLFAYQHLFELRLATKPQS